ncbi:F-box protein SKIP23-like [Lycium barbarum]|uniref:F-box protein SKIP23-like n=1 Tax=Lycium barbarum TaxID=112863 RepID=UPI00293E4AA6|nr:F-box protein SKIP23-like [Lycium barbarum]
MDHLRFRSICSLWRSSSLPLRKPPLPSLPTLPDPFCPKTRKKPYFVEKTVYLLQIQEDLWNSPLMKGFKRSFLIEVSKPLSGDKLRLESLLSHAPLENRAKSSESRGSVLNLWNLRVTELCKVFYTPKRESGISALQISRAGRELAAMAIDDDMQLYHYKSGEKKWTKNDICCDWHDIINYQGQFCAVDIEGRTLLFDSSSFAETEISPPMVDNLSKFVSWKVLVESCGELFLVELYEEKTKVYRLNMEENAWIQVENLGDRIFFIGKNCSFSLSAQEFPGCKGNCVYFNRGEGKEYDERLRFWGPKTEVYDLETRRFGGITSFPEHLEIFWPPPKWLEHPSLLSLGQ